MEKNIKDFAKFFAENDEKLIKDMEIEYLNNLVRGMVTMNTIFTMSLLHRGPLKRNEEDLFNLVSGCLDPLHENLINAMISGIKGSGEDNEVNELFAMLGSDGDELITKVRTALDRSFNDIKKGLFEGFWKTCELLSKLDTDEKTKENGTNINPEAIKED